MKLRLLISTIIIVLISCSEKNSCELKTEKFSHLNQRERAAYSEQMKLINDYMEEHNDLDVYLYQVLLSHDSTILRVKYLPFETADKQLIYQLCMIDNSIKTLKSPTLAHFPR